MLDVCNITVIRPVNMYTKEVRKLVTFIAKRLHNEAKKGSLLCKLNNHIERTSVYTGIKKRTIDKWIKEKTPEVKETKTNHFKKLDSFDIDVIVRKMKLMLDQNEVVTLKKLKMHLLKDHDLNIKKTTLWKVIKAKGFSFKKTNGNRKLLCERADLQISRCAYLRKIYDIRGYLNVVYLDESYVNANQTYPKEWMFTDYVCRKIPTGKGQRLILLHAIDEKRGFIPDCKLLFKSHSTDGRDYHSEMNSVVFEDWVEHKLLPQLTEGSCVVIDNASYHSRICPDTTAPTMKATKDEMTSWLRDRNIAYNEGLLKPELYSLIKRHKPKKEYVVDRMLEEHGHYVLRLPAYHCDLNPIENIWGILKNDVSRNNTTFKLNDMKRLVDEAIDRITIEQIKNTFEHVRKTEKAYWEKDGLFISPVVNNITISLESSSDESNSSSEDSD